MILSSSTSLIRGFSHCAIHLSNKSSCLIVVIILRQAADTLCNLPGNGQKCCKTSCKHKVLPLVTHLAMALNM